MEKRMKSGGHELDCEWGRKGKRCEWRLEMEMMDGDEAGG